LGLSIYPCWIVEHPYAQCESQDYVASFHGSLLTQGDELTGALHGVLVLSKVTLSKSLRLINYRDPAGALP